MPSEPYPVPQKNRPLTILAWCVTVLISVVPDIAWIELGGSIPSWLIYAKTGLLLIMAILAWVWKPLLPLRNFFLVMAAFFALSELRPRVDFTFPALQNLFGGSVFDIRMQAEQTGKLVISLGMIGVLLLLGYKRKDFFLTQGNLNTPIEPVRWLGFPKADPWPQFGLQWGFYIALGLGIAQYYTLRPDTDLLLKALPILPSIIFYAALNAFNEEIFFRAPMLTTLELSGGSRQALWMAAYFFGIAHYFGTPGGIIGGILSIFMGWILGKAMLETRGLFWAWWIHLLSDIVIFSFLTLSLLK